MFENKSNLLIAAAIVFCGFIALIGSLNPTGSTFLAEESINVEKQDQDTQLLELVLTRQLGNITLLQNLSLGQKIFNISSPSAVPVAGNTICIKDLDGNIFTQDEIESVVSLGGNNYEIEIKSGVEFAFSVDDGCSLRGSNMAVDGSITPITFTVSPKRLHPAVEWDLTRIICAGTGDGVGQNNDAPDIGDFFTVAAEEEGILFRAINHITYKNLFYANTNNDFVRHSYDFSTSPASKQGLYGAVFRKTVNGDDKSGVVIRLSANETDLQYHEFQAIVERDLTDAVDIECVIMGHETDNYAEFLAEQ